MASARLARSLVAIGAAAAAASAHAVVLNFDELSSAPAAYDVMPLPYHGFTFTGWFFGPDTLYTPASAPNDLFTDYADPSDPTAYVVTDANNTIASATPFHFDGAAFSGYSGVTFQLYLGGTLVHTSSTLPDAPGADPYLPTFLSSGYTGLVDQVVVSGVQGYYAMDNFTFHASAVPEIPSNILMSVGLLVAARRFLSKRAP